MKNENILRRSMALFLCVLLVYAATTPSSGAGAVKDSSLQPASFSSSIASPLGASPSQFDWSRALIATTMQRYPDPASLGKWGYAVAFFLYGVYLVYQRTHDGRYLNYIQGWVDSHVDARGRIDAKVNSLDYMLPGNLLLLLYRQTGEKQYKIAAEEIRHRLDTYPRTADGGFWHATSRPHQLWLDGLYMSLPFLVRYGKLFHDSRSAENEAARQLLIYTSHLNDPKTGLLFHAYDESDASPWAGPITHHSSVFWCRSIGWICMALLIVLNALPRNHPRRPKLLALVRQLAAALVRYQDAKTGLWFQVVNQPDLPGNWLETSSSCMFAYFLERAVQQHYIPQSFKEAACKGYRGVLARLIRDPDGAVHIPGICEGTNVGNIAYYLARKRNTDDFHGLGAFLVMNELLAHTHCDSSIRDMSATPRLFKENH